MTIRKTVLHDEHARLGARFAPFAGWDMPLNYPKGQVAEHAAVRTAAGLFDVSHMGQVRLLGPGVVDFLAWLVPADVRALGDGKSVYTMLCNAQGGVQDDLIITRLSELEWFAVINAAMAEADIAWIRARAAEHGFNGQITDECDQWAMIALQGPKALAMAADFIGDAALADSAPFTMHAYGGRLVSRTGYTGEDGVEILCPPSEAPAIWRALVDAGAEPAGLAARDSLRLEMGYPLYGNDLSESITPVEAGLGWTVSVKKMDAFIGSPVLLAQKRDGAPRARIGLATGGRRPLRAGDAVLLDGREVGVVTSGGFSPTRGEGVGIALVDSAAKGAEAFEASRDGRAFPVQRARIPFATPGSKS